MFIKKKLGYSFILYSFLKRKKKLKKNFKNSIGSSRLFNVKAYRTNVSVKKNFRIFRKFEKRTLNKKLLSMILLVKNKVMLQKKILFVFILNFNKLFFQLQKKLSNL